MARLFGRRRELAALTAAMEAAARSRGSLLVVTGGIGTGRTALLRALPPLARQRGLRVLSASGAPLERDLALGVVDQLLEPLLPGTAFEPPHDARFLAELLFSVAEFSSREPLLLLVDDLQWADPASLRWLDRLTQRLATLRIVLVVAVREGDPDAEQPRIHGMSDRAAHVLRLEPLSPADTAALVAARLDRPADPVLAAACHQACAGNPLLLTAVLAELAEAGGTFADPAGAVAGLRLPAVRERLLVALDAQPAPVRALAKALALLGDHADPELAGRLAGLDETGRSEAVGALCRLGLFSCGRSPAFVHRYVREAVEESLSPAEQEDGRRRAAVLLHDAGYPAEQAAAQLLATSWCQDGWATEVLRSAATAAVRRGAPEDAARYLRRVLLDGAPSGPERAALLLDLAAIERAFDPAAAVRHVMQALLLLPSAEQRALAVRWIPPALLGGCPPPSVELVAKTAEELSGAPPRAGADREPGLRIEARLRHATVAGPGLLAGSVDRLRALGPTPPLRTAAERELVTVLLHGATVAQRLTAAEVAPLANRILCYEPASPAHVHTALPLLTDTLVAADAIDTVGPWLEAAGEAARRERAPVPQALIGLELTQLMLARGQFARARAQAREVLDLGAARWAPIQSMAAVVRAAIETTDGELTDRLLEAYGESIDHGHSPSMLQLVRASGAAARGDLPTALEYVLDWGRSVERADWRNPAVVPWRTWAAGLWLRMGRAAQAHDLVDEELSRALAWGAPGPVGRAQRVKGELVGGEGGIELLRASMATLEGAVNEMERARTGVVLGQRLRALGRPEEAEAHLRRGRERALACGAPRLAERAARELRELAQSLGPAALTRAERRVAVLAAQGASNKEIATRLAVGTRAVEKHLTQAYRKLDVAGRAELAAVAHLLPSDPQPLG
ncbi:ATP-binding protein [Kitasatospora sp. NPDC058115]|uniref:ATP-binding protein n=1 Tax=Kitasatospora sp. NPDC058115 TaxID=3346347 RepID=UPI0036DC61B5